MSNGNQVKVDMVERMPNIPSPFKMRNWEKVAQDYDAFVFDFNKTGEHLPLIWWDKTHYNFHRDTFGLASYVGTPVPKRDNHHEAINCMAAVLSATLVGSDKINQNGHNWVLMCENYFNRDNGENLYLNNPKVGTGGSFWYEIFPNILFYQLLHYYPGTGEMENEMFTVADRWYNACAAMGGSVDAWKIPDFDHTAFNFKTMEPVNNGRWIEPDAAAGIAWLAYMAYVKSGDKKYLTATDWCMQFLQERDKNPFYETLLPYGAYIAARMNAELGRNYDVHKLINWCFGPSDARPGWGIISEKWGNYDCHGLAGSLTDGGGYAFAMGTFQMAGALTPLVRYDKRYARTIGKLVLNIANNSRLFYANALPIEHQSCRDWSDTYDKDYCIAYEGLRKHGRFITKVEKEQTVCSIIASGSYVNTLYLNDGSSEVLQEKDDRLEHIWITSLPSGNTHILINGYAEGKSFKFSYATELDGTYTEMFTITSSSLKLHWFGLPKEVIGTVYIKVESVKDDSAESEPGILYVDCIFATTDSDIVPYGMGDGISGYPHGTQTDFGLYGSSHVGILGGIISTTNNEKILQLDMLKTDYHRADAYPTYLYYNPYNVEKEVEINVGSEPKDLYDAVTGRFLKTRVKGLTSFAVAADSAVILVVTPAGGKVIYDGNKMVINSVIVDWMIR